MRLSPLFAALALFVCLGLGLVACAPREPLPEEIVAAKAKADSDYAKELERKKLQDAAAQHLANLEPIGHSVESKGLPDEGRAVRSEAGAIGDALGIAPADLPAPKRNLEQWIKDSEEARGKLVDEREKLAKELHALRTVSAALAQRATVAEADAEKARKEADTLWNKVRNSAITGGILTVGVSLLTAFNTPAGHLARVALSAVIPGMNRARKQVKILEEQHGTLVATVASADVAREGLRALDEKLGPNAKAAIMTALSDLTGKEIGSLEDYFKSLARGHAVDTGTATKVDAMLDELRDQNPTAGGASTSLLNLLKAWQAGAPAPRV